MLLAIDIGNTNIKLGIYEGNQLVKWWRVTTERQKLADEYAVLIRNLFLMTGIDMGAIQGCVISCVVPPLTAQFRELCQNYLQVDPIMVSTATKTGMRYLIDNQAELGADRIANSLAAYHKYGGPVIVIAFGTATAVDVVTAEGDYDGGQILPGIGISADALFKLAAQLYQVELVRPPRVIGKNTIHQLQSGLLFGYAGQVEGLVRRIHEEIGTPCPVIATGGLSDVLAGETNAITAVEPYLTLEGLRLIYEMNNDR